MRAPVALGVGFLGWRCWLSLGFLGRRGGFPGFGDLDGLGHLDQNP